MELSQIKNLATGTENRTIRHQYTEEELVELKHNFFDNDSKLNDKQEELDAIKEQFKFEMKPMKESASDLRKKIRNRFIDRDVHVYAVANQESGRMEYYDTITGEMVEERKLQPSERQIRLQVAATGTH